MKAALLVIDVQKAYASDEGIRRAYEDAAGCINAAAGLFRERGHLVVSVYHHDADSGPHPGEAGYEFADEFVIGTPDIIVSKHEGNAFYGTDLAAMLKASGAGTVVVSGFRAECCVLDTYRGAEERGFEPIFLHGGLASPDREAVGFVERLGSIISIGALFSLLPNLQGDGDS
jgi:nicotinamidase-related amidase